MPNFLVQKAAAVRLKEIHAYTRKRWGDDQARRYISGIFERFQQIADREAVSRPTPAEFDVHGYYTIYEKHFIYWKELASGEIGIVTVLHARMHQLKRFTEDSN